MILEQVVPGPHMKNSPNEWAVLLTRINMRKVLVSSRLKAGGSQDYLAHYIQKEHSLHDFT